MKYIIPGEDGCITLQQKARVTWETTALGRRRYYVEFLVNDHRYYGWGPTWRHAWNDAYRYAAKAES